ncbi:proteophosphoglycan ppg4 [Rhodotorula toruloides]|uniref:Proteophosphoglycan ppg4 n=1 Tax=Rhodotorula toruloides TaxID=5286 RepID=A0A511KL40_RHOTO|nr:proteophosphoglycan ppg4 [Rhodotorula toruloides]
MAGETTSEEVFEGLVERYLSNLGPTKRGKALIDNELFAFILDTLRDPSDTTLGDSGERYWARAHFELIRPADDQHGEVLGPKGDPLVRYFTINQKTRKRTAEKSVAQRHEIYEIVKEAHERTKHGGRDKTYSAVKAEWSHIPKDLVTGFIKHCPTCSDERGASPSKAEKAKKVKLPALNSLKLPTRPPPPTPATTATLHSRKTKPSREEANELDEPLGMAALLVAASALFSPPLPTCPTEDTQDFSSQLHPQSFVMPTPEHRWSSSSTSPSLHSPQQSPFRPMSLFDPVIKSSTSLLSEPLETSPTLSARQLTLTPASSSGNLIDEPFHGDAASDAPPSKRRRATCSPSYLR